MVRQPNDDAFLHRFCRWVMDRLPRFLVDDAEHGVELLACCFLFLPPGQRLGHGVHVGDAAFGIGGDNRIADAGERRPQAFALFLKPTLRNSHGLPEGDDDGAGEQVKHEAHIVVNLIHDETATGLDEEVVARKEAESRGEKGRSVAPIPDGDGDGPEQRDERQEVAHERVQQPTK